MDCVEKFSEKWRAEAGPLELANKILQGYKKDPELTEWIKEIVDLTEKSLTDGGQIPCKDIVLLRHTLTNIPYYQVHHPQTSHAEAAQLAQLGGSLRRLSSICTKIPQENL